MNYEKYKKSRDAVWQLLIDIGAKELPIRVIDICHMLGISVKIADLKSTDGKTMILSGEPIILVRKITNTGRLRFTIAHELGHIILGHVGIYELVNREPSPSDNPIEQEANIFASRLLCPACVLWGCNVKTADDIVRLCDVSKTAAEYRMKRMNELYRRQKFLTSSYERAVFDNFKEFINRHRDPEDF